MGTVADKLNKVLSTKDAIKAAIIEKGQTVANTDTFASYPDKIRAIVSGSKVRRVDTADVGNPVSISSNGKLTINFPSEIPSAANVICMYCSFVSTSVSSRHVVFNYTNAFNDDTDDSLEILVQDMNTPDVMLFEEVDRTSTNSITTLSANSSLKAFAGKTLEIETCFIWYAE